MPHTKGLLPLTYFPKISENRMEHAGNVARAREFFLAHRPNNLYFLLKHRYEWMNDYINGQEKVIELGAGAGFSKEYIKNPRLVLTDVVSQPWIDEVVDAMSLPYAPASIDVIVCNHMIHHLAEPKTFFNQAIRVLKPGGRIVISEINTSWLMRLVLKLMRHEGWSYETDVFGSGQTMEDPDNPWTANCAIPEMLFTDGRVFEKHFPQLQIQKNRLSECFLLLCSGGVIAKTKTVQLPMWALKTVAGIDSVLTSLFPGFFAMERRVVLQKRL